MIVVLHRERSEKLARAYWDAIYEMHGQAALAWDSFSGFIQEDTVAAFDSLIQAGLICAEQHRPEGRE